MELLLISFFIWAVTFFISQFIHLASSAAFVQASKLLIFQARLYTQQKLQTTSQNILEICAILVNQKRESYRQSMGTHLL